MTRLIQKLAALCVGILFVHPASAQFVEQLTDFESVPGAVDFVSEVVFRDPDFSATTRGIVIVGPVAPGSFITESGLAPSPFTETSSGARSSVSFWKWVDAGDHTSFVRLTTNDTQHFPNPAIHLGGKVRMWLGANAWTDETFSTQVTSGNLLVGIGVRETGLGVPLGFDGDIVGDVESVGLSDRLVEVVSGSNGICETTAIGSSDDVQVVAAGMPAPHNGVCVGAGTNGFIQTPSSGDDLGQVTPVGKYSVPTDGVMRLYEFDLPMAQSNGEVFRFFTFGDGILLATPNNRGVLEHLLITNDPANLAADAEVIYFFVDDIEFEAPVPSPPTIVPNPAPRPLDESVALEGIDPAADLVEVIQVPSTLLTSIDPMGATSLAAPTGLLPSLVELVARQRVGGVFSDLSVPILVNTPGNAPLRLAASIRETDGTDHGLLCGESGTGFNASGAAPLEYIGVMSRSSFNVPDGQSYHPDPDWQEVTFDPCVHGVTFFSGNGVIDLNPNGDTVGVWESLYFRIDDLFPSQGPFTIYIDDLTVKNADSSGMDCVVDDFESYTPGEFIIGDAAGNGQADTAAVNDDVQVIPVGGVVNPGQIIVSPGANGILDTAPNGDDLQSALRARFALPNQAGGSVGVASSPDVSEITDERAFTGSNSLKIGFAFENSANSLNTLRLTSNVSVGEIAPEVFLNPNSVIPLEYFPCSDGQDAVMSFMMLLEPPPIPADCDGDGDVDLEDMACFQLCMGESPVPVQCEKVSLAPNGAPDMAIDLADYALFNVLISGPK